jgi:hypothetical protein
MNSSDRLSAQITLGRDGEGAEPNSLCPRHQPLKLEEGDVVLLEARVDVGKASGQ